MLIKPYKDFLNQISQTIDTKRIFTDPLHTLAYGTDASFYRLIPKIVIKAKNEDEIKTILLNAKIYNLSVTFRAAGTSLSGQAVSDSILVLCNFAFWNKFEVGKNGTTITLDPGIVGAFANKILAKYNKKIGPDPASINSAMIGGIAANNASGMCCGIDYNSYNTLKNMRIILGDGTILDTASQTSKDEFLKTHQYLIDELNSLSQRVKKDPILTAKIRKKYSVKNTTGYSINALIDFEDPFEILQHLMIGSEGTLGFISKITYETVDEYPNKASALILFNNIEEASSVVARLKPIKDLVNAVELMDRVALRSVENKEGIPQFYKTLDEDVTALLIQVASNSKEDLLKKIKDTSDIVNQIQTVKDFSFTSDPVEYGKYWGIRKGLFPSVGALRELDTTVIIEDIAFEIDKLAPAMTRLHQLFKKHRYDEAIIFGHALEGNIHFVFTQNFSKESEVKRYEAFMDDVSNMVVKEFDGSLKAEHGTGRNMAPYVELEWGNDAYTLMKEIKTLFDKEGILNPGVIINEDKSAHIKNLKPMPPTHPIVDKCIECGFCEVNCPSKDLTITPRQRVVINREISRLAISKENNNRLHELQKIYHYEGEETCAADGLCATSCPVGIDTGKLTKVLRSKEVNDKEKKIASLVGKNFSTITALVKPALFASNALHSAIGSKNMKSLMGSFRNISKKVPYWSIYMPKNASSLKMPKNIKKVSGKIVYFPSCVSRTMGPAKGYIDHRSIHEVMLNLLEKAGYEVIVPQNLNNLCCGTPFESKGFKEEANRKISELKDELLKASGGGNYPILCDTSPCTYRMVEHLSSELNIYEPITFANKFLLDKLNITKSNKAIAIHTTCSSKKLGLEKDFFDLASSCSNKVIVPDNVGCCGFAGDRGFNYPELNASALSQLKQSITQNVAEGFSTSRTCEIGLSEHSGIYYNSILYLLDRVSVSKVL